MKTTGIGRAARWMGVIAAVAAACIAEPAQATVRDWVGTTGRWDEVANWDGGLSLPGSSDDVTITNAGASVTLTGSVSVLSLTLSKTLAFTNWSTCLTVANDVLITNSGVMTCAGPFLNAPAMSNRVYVLCSNFIVAADGSVNVDAKGYAGGIYAVQNGQGPGGGGAVATYYAFEAGTYGGFGYIELPAPEGYLSGGRAPYGSPEAPAAPGSGGDGAADRPGGAGGGAVWIVATGVVTVNGAISAKGGLPPAGGSSGSGGGIYIQCDRIVGVGGTVRANGGDASTASYMLGGGGGRVAVHYNGGSQGAVPVPDIRFEALPGIDREANYGGYASKADIGSLWFADTRFWSADMALLQGQLFGVTNWTTSALTLTNRWVGFSEEGFELSVTGNVRVDGPLSGLSLGGPLAANYCSGGAGANARYRYGGAVPARMTVGGDLLVTNQARMFVCSAMTNAVYPEYGAQVRVVGAMSVATNSCVYLSSHPTNGGSARLNVGNLAVNVGGTIRADKGYAGGTGGPYVDGYGPGGGTGGGYWSPRGGGYGGFGGGGSVVYGSSNAPVDPGSGGEAGGDQRMWGRPGGGLVWIESSGRVDLSGTISADAPAQNASSGAGGGSGGGVYLRCRTFCGAGTAVISANGDPVAWGGGGGGGRIAVWRTHDVSTGAVTTSVIYGSGDQAGATVGTVVWRSWSPGTVITIY